LNCSEFDSDFYIILLFFLSLPLVILAYAIALHWKYKMLHYDISLA